MPPLTVPARRRWATAVAVVLAATLLAACGGDSGGGAEGGVTGLEPGSDAGRTVEMAMVEFAYEPAEVSVPADSAVRFVFPNKGKVSHEAAVGTRADHEAIEKDRSTAPDLPTVRVPAGASGELVVRFDRAGTFVVGCHELGHWAAGQIATVTVT
jgi:uncharacterized cupredoxin-like copper-binding protein